MPEKEGLMETDVDSLMRLIKERKSISVEEIAKELRVTPAVVEDWARYFEEEGLVTIRYDFTTPFVEWKEPKPDASGIMAKEIKGVQKGAVGGTEKPAPPVLPELKEAVGTVPMNIENVSRMITLAHQAIETGKFLEAKEYYRQLYEMFNRVPAIFLEKMGEIEDDLIKLNNEIVVTLENKLQDEMKQSIIQINAFLKEAYALLKKRDFDGATAVYNKIKEAYKQLPQGFFEEKNAITKKVLAFYENLNTLRSTLAESVLKEKSGIIAKQLDAAKHALLLKSVDEAAMAYTLAREAYTLLPEGYFEEKIALQQKLLEVHQQIVDMKKQTSVTQVQAKAQVIQALLAQIKELLAKKDVIAAVQRYAEIKESYSQMPKGFLKNEHALQNELLKTYREIMTAKNNLALDAIHSGKAKIDVYLKKARKYSAEKDFDIGFQYYKESVEVYNALPHGFDKTKIEVRNNIYDAYFELVSHSDIVTLGELEGYAREKYFSLLKLIVNAYEVVGAGKFSLLPEVYRNIYLIYQELPLSLVSKKTKLREGIKNIYAMYKLYSLIEELNDAEQLRDFSGIQSTLAELAGVSERVANEVPNSAPLVNYVQLKLARYHADAGISMPKEISEALGQKDISELPALPAPRADRDKADGLLKKAMNCMAIKNYSKAQAYAREIIRLEPDNGTAKAMMEEIELERHGKGITSEVEEDITSAVDKFERLDYRGAIADAERALKIEPDNEEAYLVLQKAKSALRSR